MAARSVLPVLPVEIWHQILSHVMTPIEPVSIDFWLANHQPFVIFSDVDVKVERSFDFFTGELAGCFFFPISIPDIWRHLVSQATWSVEPDRGEIRDTLCKHYLNRVNDRVRWAQGLERLQTTFKAQVQYVEVVIDTSSYFGDRKVEELVGKSLPKNQWASATMSYVPSIIETCKSLKSLRLYLKFDGNLLSFEDFYRKSHAFSKIWKYTSPVIRRDGKDWEPIADWKADCKRIGVDFKIVARTFAHNPRSGKEETMEDDLTEFWDLPTYIKEEWDLFSDQHLTRAVNLHIRSQALKLRASKRRASLCKMPPSRRRASI